MITASSDPRTLGRSFGVHRSLDTVGAALGPLLAFVVLWAIPDGYQTVFVISFGCAVIGLAALVLLVPDLRPRRAAWLTQHRSREARKLPKCKGCSCDIPGSSPPAGRSAGRSSRAGPAPHLRDGRRPRPAHRRRRLHLPLPAVDATASRPSGSRSCTSGRTSRTCRSRSPSAAWPTGWAGRGSSSGATPRSWSRTCAPASRPRPPRPPSRPSSCSGCSTPRPTACSPRSSVGGPPRTSGRRRSAPPRPWSPWRAWRRPPSSASSGTPSAADRRSSRSRSCSLAPSRSRGTSCAGSTPRSPSRRAGGPRARSSWRGSRRRRRHASSSSSAGRLRRRGLASTVRPSSPHRPASTARTPCSPARTSCSADAARQRVRPGRRGPARRPERPPRVHGRRVRPGRRRRPLRLVPAHDRRHRHPLGGRGARRRLAARRDVGAARHPEPDPAVRRRHARRDDLVRHRPLLRDGRVLDAHRDPTAPTAPRWATSRTSRSTVDGEPFTAADRNIWGVTFVDDDTFYATAASQSGGQDMAGRGLRRGPDPDLGARGRRVPVALPDGTQVAFKKVGPADGQPGWPWRCSTSPRASETCCRRDPATSTTRPSGSTTTRSSTACPGPTSRATPTCGRWTPADATPALLIRGAWSPAVVR